MRKPSIDRIFEVSWEVCNKVGGIYTVLSSKAFVLQKLYKDKIIFIGPDLGQDASIFEEEPYLGDSILRTALPYGLTMRIGRWKVPGNPLAILVDFKRIYEIKDAIYATMWHDFGVDSLHAYGDYDEACAFSVSSAVIIGNLFNYIKKKNLKVIAHFDEWTTGMGVLYLRKNFPEIATVFTTHATCIGRSICGNNKPLYGYLQAYDGDQMAHELNMQSKHSLEKAAVHAADCYTTVSDVTARESVQLLSKKPDIVTPNGFEKELVSNRDDSAFSSQRSKSRDLLIRVAESLTGKKYGNDTLIVATSGRNEYRNKGIDLFLDSIKALEDQISTKRQVLAFIMVPAWTKERRSDLKKALEEAGEVASDRNITHSLHNPDVDVILKRIRELNFFNGIHNNVNVIYVPCYLNGNDGIFNVPYYELLQGFDLTVFPSYYEPWGYTPLESIAFGIPTITTSLSGFGQWILSNFQGKDIDETGVAVVDRTDFNYNEVKSRIADIIKKFAELNNEKVSKVRKSSLLTASKAEWLFFIDYYLKAFKIALNKQKARTCNT